MNFDRKKIDELKDILREIEYIEYEDPDEGLQIFCPMCWGTPKRENLPKGVRAMYPSMGGKGHDENCKLGKEIS